MTKMATMPIYGKKRFKNLLQNRWTDFKETWHEASMAKVLQCVYKSWPCGDLDLFYDKVNIGRQCIWMGKTFKSHLRWKSCRQWSVGLNLNDSENKLDPRAYLAPPRGYINIYYHNIQTSSPLKPLGRLKPNFMWSTYRIGEQMCLLIIYSRSHEQKNPSKIFFSETSRQISMKLGVEH